MGALTPAQEWWTAEEIAASGLPDIPATRQGVAATADRLQWRAQPGLARRRAGKGGGWEYHWHLFPDRARRKLLQAAAAVSAAPVAPVRIDRDEAWTWYEGLPQAVKAKATTRLKAVREVEALEAIQGRGRHMAVGDVARLSGIGARTIWTWFAMIDGVRSDDRLPYLAPRNRAQAERSRSKDCEPDFFDWIKSAYLRLAGPCFTDCYRDAMVVASANGWEVLPERTMRRRLDRAVSRVTQVLAREGVEALQRLYPPQVRDKTMMTAMEGVNADFHKFDVFVRWPAPFGQNEPGQIIRPQMVAFQDIYSGRILSWRVDQTPNSTAVQLAAGDMIETYGIPRHVLFDNGHEFAAKCITGGAANRFRFKVKEDDPLGLFAALDCKIHWATPHHGQAKPIERGFRDMCSSIAKDVRFDGAYTGNTPMAKPEDYGSRAIDLDYFLKVLAERIAEHNTRQNRRSPVAYNRSFAEVFDESYATAPIRKATEAQRRLWLLGAEGLRADTHTGAVWFQKNEFWDAWMHEIAGERVIVRFDPADYLAGLHVYAQDGAYLGHAPVRQAVGFFDADEARVTARARKDWMNAEKKALAALKRYDAAQLGSMLDAVAPVAPEPVEAKVVKPVFGRPLRAAAPVLRDEHPMSPALERLQAEIVTDLAARRQPEPARPPEDDALELFRQALAIEARQQAAEPVTPEEARWLQGYQAGSAYRAHKAMHADFGDAMFG
jgi:putative transposase